MFNFIFYFENIGVKWIINFDYKLDSYAIIHERGHEWILPKIGWKFWSGKESVADKTLKIKGDNYF